MPGECYPAFHLSLAVLCVLVRLGPSSGRLCFYVNVWPRMEMWTWRVEDASLRLFTLLCLCALFILQLCCPLLSLLPSISDNAREAALLSKHTHTLYYILRTLIIHNYIIASNSQRTFIQCSSFIVCSVTYNTRDDEAEMGFRL